MHWRAATATLSLLHSCLDFTLQVPGYSIPFFALFGAGLAQSFRTGEARPTDEAEPQAGQREAKRPSAGYARSSAASARHS